MGPLLLTLLSNYSRLCGFGCVLSAASGVDKYRCYRRSHGGGMSLVWKVPLPNCGYGNFPRLRGGNTALFGTLTACTTLRRV